MARRSTAFTRPEALAFFEGAGQLDGLIDRRRSRHLHIAGLRQRGAEDLPHLRVELCKAPLGEKLAQDIVQRSLMFQHGIKKSRWQMLYRGLPASGGAALRRG